MRFATETSTFRLQTLNEINITRYTMYIDSHTHFDMALEDTNLNEYAIMRNLREKEISHSVQVAVDVDNFSWSHNFAKKYQKNGVLFTLGIHPSSKAGDSELEKLKTYLNNVMDSADKDLLFGIGECGLDYYRMRQKKEMQQESFITPIFVALASGSFSHFHQDEPSVCCSPG